MNAGLFHVEQFEKRVWGWPMLASPFLLETQIYLFQLDAVLEVFFAAGEFNFFGIGQRHMPRKIGIG